MYADMMDTIGFVSKYDEEVGKAMNLELARQQRNIELIASENIVSPAVMAAMGSVLTNKYAEGYPGRRYYGGYRVSLSLPKEEFQLWKDRFKENLLEDRLSSITNRDSSHIRLRKFTGWEEKSEDGDIPYVQGSASFLLTGGGMTQLVYITAVIIEKEEDVLLALFISDHKQDTRGIPFGKMAELPPAGAEDS